MANTFPPSISVVDDLSKNPNNQNVVYKESSAAGPSLKNINTSNKIHIQPQMVSRNNAAPTQLFSNPQLSQNSSIDNISTYTAWSILNIMFCCLCVGCLACWYSTETERLKTEGNIQAALKASRKTRNWNIIGTLGGITIISLCVIINFIYG
jgi:hypothetical protein